MKAGIVGILSILIGASPAFSADECDELSTVASGLYAKSRDGRNFVRLGKSESIEFERGVRFYFVQDVANSKRENIWNIELLTSAVDNKEITAKIRLQRGAVRTDCDQDFDGVALAGSVNSRVDRDGYFGYLARRHQDGALKSWHFTGGSPYCENTRSLVGEFEDLNDGDDRARKIYRPKKAPVEQIPSGEAIANDLERGEKPKPNKKFADLTSVLVFKAKREPHLCREVDPLPGLWLLSRWKPSRTKIIIRNLESSKVAAYVIRWTYDE